jgi:hypothetical protein
MLRYCKMYRYARREGRRGVGNGKGVGREENNKNNNSIYICERRLYFIDDKSKNSVSIPFSLLPVLVLKQLLFILKSGVGGRRELVSYIQI